MAKSINYSRAEIQFRMCPNQTRCLQHQPCPFIKDGECTIDNGAHRQTSIQHVNNMSVANRAWTLAAYIKE